MKKAIVVLILIVLIFSITVAYGIGLLGSGSSEPKTCSDILRSKNIDNLDGLEDINLLSNRNTISYFECSADKERMIQLCNEEVKPVGCNEGFAVVYIMYLYKTGRTDAPDQIVQIIYDDMIRKGKDVTSEDVYQLIHDYLNSDIIPHDAKDLRIFRYQDTEQILSESSGDELLSEYYNNIVVFRNANSISDCDNMILHENRTNIMSIFLEDACGLTFAQDKNGYCKTLIDNEIDSCNSSI